MYDTSRKRLVVFGGGAHERSSSSKTAGYDDGLCGIRSPNALTVTLAQSGTSSALRYGAAAAGLGVFGVVLLLLAASWKRRQGDIEPIERIIERQPAT